MTMTLVNTGDRHISLLLIRMMNGIEKKAGMDEGLKPEAIV